GREAEARVVEVHGTGVDLAVDVRQPGHQVRTARERHGIAAAHFEGGHVDTAAEVQPLEIAEDVHRRCQLQRAADLEAVPARVDRPGVQVRVDVAQLGVVVVELGGRVAGSRQQQHGGNARDGLPKSSRHVLLLSVMNPGSAVAFPQRRNAPPGGALGGNDRNAAGLDALSGNPFGKSARKCVAFWGHRVPRRVAYNPPMHLIGAFRAARHACLALLALAGAAGAGQHAGTAPGGPVAPGGADEPFGGAPANGPPAHGLYRLQETGVSTAPLAQAARAFLAALTPAQRERSTFRIDDPEWRQWTNHGHATRRGIALAEMDERARKAALDLLAASLSPAGFDRVRDIMSLASPDEGRYWMTVRGEPSATGPWGWRLEGHHLVINCFVLGDQVVLTPLSLGAGPRAGRAGSRAATDVLRQEEAG